MNVQKIIDLINNKEIEDEQIELEIFELNPDNLTREEIALILDTLEKERLHLRRVLMRKTALGYM